MRMRNAVRGSSLKAPLYYWSFSLLLIFLLAHVAESVLGEDGICNIFAFVPFTIEYVISEWCLVSIVCISETTAQSTFVDLMPLSTEIKKCNTLKSILC